MLEPIYFLLHVPKCAGSTVEQHFRERLGGGFLLAPRRRGIRGASRAVFGPHSTLAGLSAEALAALRLLSGHSLSQSLANSFANRPVRQCVLLRDPLGYFLSFYNYRIFRHRQHGEAPPPDFADWYRGMRRNPVSRFIMNRYFEVGYPRLYAYSSADRLAFLNARLAAFEFVGSYRHCTEMIAGISKALGIDGTVRSNNVTPTYDLAADDLDDGLRDRILEENALDQALFDQWRDRKWKGVGQGGEPDLPRGDRMAAFRSDVRNLYHRRWRS